MNPVNGPNSMIFNHEQEIVEEAFQGVCERFMILPDMIQNFEGNRFGIGD
jgi:hypothetical protein